ncbi:MAG: response regulator [Epsilonproteobacteria bacterium]|nr:response regulator [Campylobacterota bacterium]
MDFKLVHEYTKDLNILYVEDNESIRRSTQKVFENFFKSVDTAIDGDDGLEVYQDFYKTYNLHYDLVITDINMPVLDGIEMSKKILSLNVAQPIVFITAHNETEYLLQAIRMGVSGFLIKPLEIDELINIFYKTCQSIHDKRLICQHYDQIEAYSTQLQAQNNELQEKNSELEKSLRMLDTFVYKSQPVVEEKSEVVQEKRILDNFDRIEEQISYLIKDDLPELKDLHLDIDSCLIEIISSDADEEVVKENLPKIAASFSKYAYLLQLYSFYHELSDAISSFTRLMNTSDLPIEKESRLNIFLFLESFMYVLGKWQNDIGTLEHDKLNYLDASLISDIATISTMWKQEEVEEEGELEFF